jgi:hypothetical protein
MTPKLKAENLVDSYRIVLMNEDTECGEEILCTVIAKQCALIAVDNVLWMASHYATIDYWNEVKQEIQAL